MCKANALGIIRNAHGIGSSRVCIDLSEYTDFVYLSHNLMGKLAPSGTDHKAEACTVYTAIVEIIYIKYTSFIKNHYQLCYTSSFIFIHHIHTDNTPFYTTAFTYWVQYL